MKSALLIGIEIHRIVEGALGSENPIQFVQDSGAEDSIKTTVLSIIESVKRGHFSEPIPFDERYLSNFGLSDLEDTPT